MKRFSCYSVLGRLQFYIVFDVVVYCNNVSHLPHLEKLSMVMIVMNCKILNFELLKEKKQKYKANRESENDVSNFRNSHDLN